MDWSGGYKKVAFSRWEVPGASAFPLLEKASALGPSCSYRSVWRVVMGLTGISQAEYTWGPEWEWHECQR